MRSCDPTSYRNRFSVLPCSFITLRLYLLAARRHGVLGQLTTGGREMPPQSDCRLLVVNLLHEPLLGGVGRVVARLCWCRWLQPSQQLHTGWPEKVRLLCLIVHIFKKPGLICVNFDNNGKSKQVNKNPYRMAQPGSVGNNDQLYNTWPIITAHAVCTHPVSLLSGCHLTL